MIHALKTIVVVTSFQCLNKHLYTQLNVKLILFFFCFVLFCFWLEDYISLLGLPKQNTTITKYKPRLDVLNKRNLFFHGSGCWKFKIKVLSGLVSSEASFLGLQIVALWCLHMVFSLWVHIPVSLCVQISFSYKTPVKLDWSPPCQHHFTVITS